MRLVEAGERVAGHRRTTPAEAVEQSEVKIFVTEARVGHRAPESEVDENGSVGRLSGGIVEGGNVEMLNVEGGIVVNHIKEEEGAEGDKDYQDT